MCLVGFVYKIIFTWEVVKLIFFCSERELEVYKLGEMYPEWKPVYLHAKKKSKIYMLFHVYTIPSKLCSNQGRVF